MMTYTMENLQQVAQGRVIEEISESSNTVRITFVGGVIIELFADSVHIGNGNSVPKIDWDFVEDLSTQELDHD